MPKGGLLLPHPQRRNKRLLRDPHGPIFPHPRLALLLLVEELLLSRNVAAVAFGGDVLAQRRDGFAGDDLADTPALSLSKGRPGWGS
jgi:hypothetical protein